jgi:hypothetical protein
MYLVTKLQQVKMQHKVEDFRLGKDESLLYKNQIYVPNSHDLRSIILKEMHNVPYVGHPGYQKTITVVKNQSYWPGMKRYIVEYIANCIECQKVKAEHRKPIGLPHPFPILE